jgi:hypothetical protein
VCLFGLVAVGMFIASATAIFELPRTYRTLADHGVRALATTTNCTRENCALTYTFAGHEHTNRYSNDLSQFCCANATLVLVDPKNPETMYTVRDVQHETNAGVGVVSILTALLGLFMTGMAVFFVMVLRRLPRQLPPPLGPPPPDLPPVNRALYSTLLVQEVLDDAAPLPGNRWFRVDRDKLTAGVETMRRNLAEIPGPKAQTLDLADRVARDIHAAPRIPLIGGARVRATDLSEQLDQIRMTVLDTMRSAN